MNKKLRRLPDWFEDTAVDKKVRDLGLGDAQVRNTRFNTTTGATVFIRCLQYRVAIVPQHCALNSRRLCLLPTTERPWLPERLAPAVQLL